MEYLHVGNRQGKYFIHILKSYLKYDWNFRAENILINNLTTHFLEF